jgi:diguanylate cyclase (GGDEF)-like protein
LLPVRRTRSLRTFLSLGLGLLGLAFLLMSAELRFFVQPSLDAEVESQGRALVRHQAQQELLESLLEEEVALRTFLESGDQALIQTMAQYGREQGPPLRALSENLPVNAGARGLELLQHLEFAINTFHQQSVIPLVNERVKGPLKDAKAGLAKESQHFEEVKAANQQLTRVLDGLDDERLQVIENTLQYGRWLGYVTASVVFLLALYFARWLLLRVAAPLGDLSEQARAGDGFPLPEEFQPVKEVDILARTLHDLDVRGREREQVLRREHDEALATRAFEELVQHIAREEDLLLALDQALARQLGTTGQSILLLAPAGEGMVSMLPLLGLEESARHAVLADANRCRAIHQGAPVCLAADSPTCCICTLGVPRSGSYLCLPMVASGRTLGLVNLQASNSGHWTPERRRVAEAFVSASAAALQAIRALDTARERAVRDGLTGVFNRRFLDEFLPKAIDQAARKDLPLTVLMLDIDHFKAFNDEFGHEGGDQVLRLVAQCIQNHVRSGDVVARYGGEEFAVLMPHANPEYALALAERLRTTLQSMPLPDGSFPRDRHVTVSIGVASFPEHTRNREAVLSLADQALYEAKGLGRNRTISAAELGLGLPRPDPPPETPSDSASHG